MDAAKSGTDAVSAPFYDVIFGALHTLQLGGDPLRTTFVS
jgi:hypothetical protein